MKSVRGTINTLRRFATSHMSNKRSYIDVHLWHLKGAPEAYKQWMKTWVPVREDQVGCDYVGGRFLSPWAKETEKTIGKVLKWTTSRKIERIEFDDSDPGKSFRETIPIVPVDLPKIESTDRPHFTWLGHASCYLQTEGLHIMTDPVFSDRASPVSFSGPARFIPPPVHANEVKVDVVLLSHSHYDHLDMPTAKEIGNRALWVVPVGMKDYLSQHAGITNCVELNWWQEYHMKAPNGKDVKIVFTPTKHWTARTPWDRNTSLWGSFALLSDSCKFFFSGDGGYCDVFKTVGDLYGPFDVAALGIGAYKPRWFMKGVHMSPAEAVQVRQDLRCKQAIAMHWGTFPLADEDYLEPALELARAREEVGVTAEQFFTMAHGETVFQGEGSKYDFATIQPKLMQAYLKHIEKHGNSSLL